MIGCSDVLIFVGQGNELCFCCFLPIFLQLALYIFLPEVKRELQVKTWIRNPISVKVLA